MTRKLANPGRRGVPKDGSRNPGWANAKVGWGHLYKSPSFIPAGGEGRGGERSNTPPHPAYTAVSQPPAEHKVIGRMEAKEYREALKARREKGLAVVDKLLDRALADDADLQTLVAAARQHEANVDRIDGKPNQSISGPDGGAIPTTMTVSFVKPRARDATD